GPEFSKQVLSEFQMRRNRNLSADCPAFDIRIATFGQGDNKSSFAEIVSGFDQTVPNGGRDEVLNGAFIFQVQLSDVSHHGLDENNRVPGTPKCITRHEPDNSD